MTHFRAALVAGTLVLGAAGLAIAPTAPAGAASRLNAPAGAHLISAKSSSLTVKFHRTSGARRYRLKVSTVKRDLYYRNLDKSSRHARTATARKPRIRVHGLTYTTAPFYYRVAAVNGRHDRWSANFRTAYLRPPAPTSLQTVSGPAGTYLTWHSAAVTGSVIEQATDSSFTQNVHTYVTHGPATRFTPYGLVNGTTYYFRVEGMNSDTTSSASRPVATTVGSNESFVRVLSYNTLDASFDGTTHDGGTQAPYAQRRPGQLALIARGDPAVIGVQEDNSCLKKIPNKPCYRQIDSLAAGLAPRYTLDDTDASATGPNRYAGNYILYDASIVQPVGTGGHWILGNAQFARYAQYQVFRINATGATFLFVTAHLATPRGHNWDNTRGAETASMIQDSKDYAASMGVTPIIYTGDFNSYPNEYLRVDEPGNEMRAAGFLDGIQVAQSLVDAQYDSINGLYRKAPTGEGSADHVYVSAGVGVQSWQELLNVSKGSFVGTIPSDHNPVVSGVDIPY
jgi:endonuclease/exonuclease/phosphatase family metal-dependent hydrolase